MSGIDPVTHNTSSAERTWANWMMSNSQTENFCRSVVVSVAIVVLLIKITSKKKARKKKRTREKKTKWNKKEAEIKETNKLIVLRLMFHRILWVFQTRFHGECPLALEKCDKLTEWSFKTLKLNTNIKDQFRDITLFWLPSFHHVGSLIEIRG